MKRFTSWGECFRHYLALYSRRDWDDPFTAASIKADEWERKHGTAAKGGLQWP